MQLKILCYIIKQNFCFIKLFKYLPTLIPFVLNCCNMCTQKIINKIIYTWICNYLILCVVLKYKVHGK